MAYGDFNDLPIRTAYDKVLPDKVCNVAKNTKYDGYQRGLVSMVYKYFDKKAFGDAIKSKIISNKRPSDIATRQLAEDLHKTFIRKFEKRKVYSSFKDNFWDADPTDMQLISKSNKGIRNLLCDFIVNMHRLFP